MGVAKKKLLPGKPWEELFYDRISTELKDARHVVNGNVHKVHAMEIPLGGLGSLGGVALC